MRRGWEMRKLSEMKGKISPVFPREIFAGKVGRDNSVPPWEKVPENGRQEIQLKIDERQSRMN